MRQEIIVAEKEVRDYVSSKRFWLIMGLVILLCGYSIVGGIDYYGKMLEDYKRGLSDGSGYRAEMIKDLRQQLQEAEARGAPADEIAYLKDSLDELTNPRMPSVADMFRSVALLYTFIGLILGVSMGFDLITKEKEDGTLKTVLSGPVYRDAVINGKALGALIVIGIIMGMGFLLTLAIMLFYSIVPGVDDLIRIFFFYLASMLYTATFFAISLMISTLSRSSAMSALFNVALVIGIVVFSIMALVVAGTAANIIAGPEPPIIAPEPVPVSSDVPPGPMPTITPYNSDYYAKKSALADGIARALLLASPISDYSLGFDWGLSGIILETREQVKYEFGDYPSYLYKERPVLESLTSGWMQAVAMLLEIALCFSVAYVRFVRTDIR